MIQELYKITVPKQYKQKYETYRLWILNNPEILYNYLDGYDQIVIDEIQSLYGTLTDIAKLIINRYKNIICAGDFNQQFEKIHRGDNPFLKEYLPNLPIYTLNINYRNSKKIQEYASLYLDINTTCGSNLDGSVEQVNCRTYDDMITKLNKLPTTYHYICRTEGQRTQLRKKGLIHRVYSVSQSLSLSPDTVVLITSSRVGIMEEHDEAIKEILCSILRAREKVIIYEHH